VRLPARLRAGERSRDLVLSVLAGTLAGLLVVAQAALLSGVVDAVFLRGRALAGCAPLLGGLALAAAARAGLGWSQEVLAQRYSGRVRLSVRDRLTRRLLALGPRFASGERTGELANTLVGGVDALDAYLGQYLPQAFLAALVPALVLLAVAGADPLSALVLLLTGPLVPFFMWLIGLAARERTRRQWATLSRLAARFLDALQGLPTLRAFGRDREEAEKLARAGDQYRVSTLGVLRLAFVSALALEALATLSTALVAVEVGLRLLHGRIAFGPALFVLVLTPEFYRPLRALGAAFHAGLAGREAASRIEVLLEAKGPAAAPGIEAPAVPAGGAARPSGDETASGAHAPSGPPTIRFEGVSFGYGAGRARALDALTLELPAGQTVALVGPTGAGKTTAASLLLRFLEPDEGALRVDGEPLSRLTPEEWRRGVAWVPQRPRLLHGTIRENVLLARPEARADELEAAAARARLDVVLRDLPRGWDTRVGEAGILLSGGEAQRVALARAFLKDAPVLVLDEPTAHLDAETEAVVIDGLERLRRGRTVLLIAHRFTTAAGASRVAVLVRGRVVEAGAPAALAVRGRVYPRLLAAWEATV
jgi:thiol reductant ABC exporter CydD subunit